MKRTSITGQQRLLALFRERAITARKRFKTAQAPTTGFTISGSLGSSGAGATVIVVSNTTGGPNAGLRPMACAAVVANASGNYTTPLVAPNDANTPNYIVIPILWEKEFTPFSQSVIITNANKTGLNWTGTPAIYSVNVDFTDRFQRGPQNPLGGWTTFPIDSNLQLNSSNGVEPTAVDPTVCGAYPSSFVPNSANCWCQVDLLTFVAGDIMAPILRTTTDPTVHGFDCEVTCELGSVGALWQLNDIDANGPLVSGLGFITGVSQYTFSKGDGIIIVARGSHIYLFQKHSGNQIPLGAGSSSNSPSVGKVGLQFLIGTIGQTTTQNFYSGHTS